MSPEELEADFLKRKALRDARQQNAVEGAHQNGQGGALEPASPRAEREPGPEEVRRPVEPLQARPTWNNPPPAAAPEMLPHSIVAEEGVNGCIVRHPAESIPIITRRIGSNYFYLQSTQAMFAFLVDFYNDHGATGYKGSLDVVTLEEYAKEAGQLGAIGGPQAVRAAFVGAAGLAVLDHYLTILEEKFRRREAITAAKDLARRAADEQEDISAIVEHAQERVAHLATLSAPKKSTLTIRSPSELVGMTFSESDNYFADRVLAAGQACTLLGPGGVGKSRLAMQLAVCIITGRAFLDMETHAPDKKWLFVQTENNNRRLHHDLKNLVIGLKLSPEEVAALDRCLVIHTLENDLDGFLNLVNPINYRSVNSLIQDVKPDFIEWDPLNTLTDADLNKDMDMREVVMAIATISRVGNPNRVPLVLHHSLTGKAGAARAVGWDKSSYGRNSKVLQSWTRAQINLSPRDPDDPNLLILSCGKNNNGKSFPEIGLVFDEEIGIYFKDDTFNPEEFREDVGLGSGKKKHVSPDEVAGEVEDGMPSARLAERIMQRFEVSRATAYRVIEKSRKAGKIREEKAENFKPIYFKETPKRPVYDPD